MQTEPLHFLFLYTRLPDYFYQCIRHLLLNSPAKSRATIVVYPADSNAPYTFDADEHITIIEKSKLSTLDLSTNPPALIYCAGWGDKQYNTFIKPWKGKVPVITGLDNPWKGTLRQKIAAVAAPLFLQKQTDYLWVTGYPQFDFARKLGFPALKILKGLYCGDNEKFMLHSRQEREKVILFVGRWVAYKRPDWLLEAFSELKEKYPGWKLMMIGNGPLKEDLKNRYAHVEGLETPDFVQPSQLADYYARAAVFCLPSTEEHWGVVVHEAAAAGLALITADTCGAASEFLIHGHNGFAFRSNSKQHFKYCLELQMSMQLHQLGEMGKRSQALAQRITHQSWAGTLTSVLHGR